MMRMFLALLVLLAAPVQANDDDDHDRARAAFERGAILPLSQITAIATGRFGGHVIEVEFDEDDGRYLYELEMITGSGRVIEVEIDATSGRILEVEKD
ncbi:Peptidase propeptide and YPEB domain protein [Roseovarius tolerans]|uniref:Peptidase propeptide and YPEB domain protein n=1 Tax=Roseovarius tolerans TaxID=74031 RepID=A0A0L6D0A1_9RHOB|nr:PepSY domain-containing protein [Roseovarius tolerans]KNX43128.1 Peptidase propeptide and YPEB domain protein [Roseovarius tolerans]